MQQCSRNAAAQEPGTPATHSPGAVRGPGSCLRPPSSTVGATLSSRGQAGMGERPPEPLGWEERERASFSPCALCLGQPSTHGLAPTCPGALGGPGAFPGGVHSGDARTFQDCLKAPQPPQAVFGFSVKEYIQFSLGISFPQACKNFVELHSPVAGSRAYLGRVSRSLFLLACFSSLQTGGYQG